MNRLTRLLMVLALDAGACRPTGPAPVSTPGPGDAPARPVSAPDIVCELQLSASGPHYFASFVLSNRTAQEKMIHSFEPFLDFQIQVTAAGRALRVESSEYSAGQRPAVIRVPPHGSVTVRSPIRLIFGAELQPAGLSWTIFGAPPVDVVATLNIEGERIAPCAASIPTSPATALAAP